MTIDIVNFANGGALIDSTVQKPAVFDKAVDKAKNKAADIAKGAFQERLQAVAWSVSNGLRAFDS